MKYADDARMAMKIGDRLAAITFVYWLIYTGYFGWNLEAVTHAEKVMDTIAKGGFGLAIGFWLLGFRNFVLAVLEKVSP